MPSFLGLYRGAATNRPTKLIRAIKSVLKQSMPDFELVIVADGCQETVDIVKQNFTDKRISLYQIRKQPTWSGRVRNAGINKAKSDWICYLDIDDMFGTNHLQILTDNLKGDWVWFNDLTYTLETQSFLEVHEDINVRGKCADPGSKCVDPCGKCTDACGKCANTGGKCAVPGSKQCRGRELNLI